MIYVFLAEGFEEVEALSPVDILRRGGLEVKTVGVASKTVVGSHGIPVVCDCESFETDFSNMDGIILPGGMPGTLNLEKSVDVNAAIDFAFKNGRIIGAICAAPSILGKKGLLKGKSATCFDGFEKYLSGAKLSDSPAVRDGQFITACGAGAALDFGYLLLAAFKDEATAENLRRAMKYN